MTAEQAAEIVDALPVELRQVDLAAVLGVPENHVKKMRRLNRVPPHDKKIGGPTGSHGTPIWLRENIRPWLLERLVHRDADLAAGSKVEKNTRAMLGYRSNKIPLRLPVYPFLGIGD